MCRLFSGLVCEDRAEHAQAACILVTLYDVHIRLVQSLSIAAISYRDIVRLSQAISINLTWISFSIFGTMLFLLLNTL
jgi:hypothetical protein